MRDRKKFYVPKHTKNPQSGDYEVTLNWGDKVYVEKHEFEGKLDKFFKNYQVVTDHEEDNHDYSQDYFTIVSLEDNNEIKWFLYSYAPVSTVAKNISISIDNGLTWTEYSPSNTVIATLNTNDKLLAKGTNTTYGSDGYINRFICSKRYNVEGNIMSFIYSDDFKNQTTITGSSTFSSFFSGCSNIISAKNLILQATTLTNGCYNSMFQGCISLTTAPELPATTLAASCYGNMFQGCTSLIAAPELLATTLAVNCYADMFSQCTNLITAPELPATTLANWCYYDMFNGCTALIISPKLPATTLAGYCYNNMFYNCTSLNSITCLATDISATDCTTNWVNGVSETGTFVKNTNMTGWTYGDNGIPSSWDVEEV